MPEKFTLEKLCRSEQELLHKLELLPPEQPHGLSATGGSDKDIVLALEYFTLEEFALEKLCRSEQELLHRLELFPPAQPHGPMFTGGSDKDTDLALEYLTLEEFAFEKLCLAEQELLQKLEPLFPPAQPQSLTFCAPITNSPRTRASHHI